MVPWRRRTWRRQITWRRQPWQYQALQFVEKLSSKPKLVGAVTAIIITDTAQFKIYNSFADAGSKDQRHAGSNTQY